MAKKQTAQPRKPGRPSTYTPEIAERICAELAEGLLLSQVCAQPGMPHVATVFRWLDSSPTFSESYARAKDLQADAIAAQALSIADTERRGEKEKRKQVSWSCPTCDKDARWRG